MIKSLPSYCVLCLAFFLAITIAASAQTGSFNITLMFAGGPRTVACYVPPDYDSTKTYGLLVGLHGSGHNGPDYRDVLIGSAGWPTGFPNTIFMFPDGGEDQVSDFHAPAGDEEFIGVTIAYALEKYSIDSSNVLLQGFSLGGRSALKYGSVHPEMFKGLLLNTPAIQGLADLANDPAMAPPFDYAGAATLPVFVSIGLEDDLYIEPIRQMVKKLRSLNGAVQHAEIAGMGHTIPVNSITSQAITFFNTNTQQNYDVVLFDVPSAKYTTSNVVHASASVQNLGASAVTALNVAFEVGGKSEVVHWTGSLAPNQSVTIDTLITDVPPGGQVLSVVIDNPNASEVDPNALNNVGFYYTVVRGERGTTSAAEGFESEASWNIDSSGNAFAWSYDSEVHRTGAGSLFAFNTILVFYTAGLSESVTSPFLDMSSMSNKSFTFDYAYNFHRYTAAVLGVDRDFADTLVIEASTNSGASFTTLFRKAGAELATFDAPILNPTAIGQTFANPAPTNWRHQNISLNEFANEKNLLVRLRYISGMGGFINIDNLAVGAEPVSVEEDVFAGASPDVITTSPNPASDNITFGLPNLAIAGHSTDGTADIRMFNSAGEEVMHEIVNLSTDASFHVSVASLQPGVYSASITYGTLSYVCSVAIVR